MKPHILLLACITPMLLHGQVPDTALASIWDQKIKEFRAARSWDSMIVYVDKSVVAWKDAAQKENDSLLWIKYFKARNRHADYLYMTNKYEQLTPYCDDLIREIAASLGSDHREIGRVYYMLGYAFSDQYNYSQATEYFSKSLSYFEPGDPFISKCYSRLGVSYRNQNDYENAIKYYLKAIAGFERQGDMNDAAGSLVNLGTLCRNLGDKEKAQTYLFKAYKILSASQHPYLGNCLSNIGGSYHNEGDYINALYYFQQAADFFEEKNPRYLAYVWLNMGVVNSSLNEPEKAMEFYLKAKQIFETRFPPNSPGLGNLLSAMGDLLVNQGEVQTGISYLKEGLEISRLRQDRILTNNLRSLGDCFLDLENHDKALAYYQEALTVSRSWYSQKHFFIADVLNRIGSLYIKNAQPLLALDTLQQALIANQPGFDNPNPYAHPVAGNIPLGSPVYLRTLKEKAKVLIGLASDKKGSLVAADTCYQLAIYLIDQMRQGFKQEDSKLFLQANAREVYEGALSVLFLLHEKTGNPDYLTRAFRLSEKARAIVLGESLRASKAREFAGLPLEVLELEKTLRFRQGWLESVIFDLEAEGEKADSAQLADFQVRKFNSKMSYDSLLRILEDEFPAYHRLKYGMGVMGKNEVQNKLDAQEVILSYFVGDSVLYSFGVSGQDFQCFRKPIGKEFNENLQEIRKHISSPENKDPGHLISPACSFYNLLISPFDDMIRGKQLIIIPDGALSYLPFEVLTSHTPKEEDDFRNLSYLIKDHAITYANSATLYFEDQITKNANADFLAFAPAFNSRWTENDTSKMNSPLLATRGDTVRGGLAELSGALQEVGYLANLFKGKSFSANDATETQFKTLANQFGILHLATHAIVDDNNPMDSRLLFTQTEADTVNDGDLHAWELYNMQLNAQLAVLSACNTGFGKIERGEGVMSLGRAFAYAGVPSIVMSLWPAQDVSTASLMEGFYTRLVEGKEKSIALREAKLEYLANASEQQGHPFYWAGFVVQGDAGPLEKERNWIWLLALGGALLMLGGILFWRKIRIQ